MAERTLPGLGLTGFWDLGANNWKDGMDANLRLLSVIARGWAKSRTTPIPTDGAAGDVYVVPSDAAAEANSIAIWDGVAGSEVWIYVPPQIGLRFFVQDDGKNYQWDGTEWTLLAAGGSGGTGGAVLRPFAPYPTNAASIHTDTVSTSAFALKGNLYGCTEDLTLAGVDVYIDNDTEGGNYQLHILEVDNSTLDVTAVTAVSSLTFSEASSGIVSFPLGGVELKAGNRYAIAVVATNSNTFAAKVPFSGDGFDLPGLDFVADLQTADNSPAVGATLTSSGSNAAGMVLRYAKSAEVTIAPHRGATITMNDQTLNLSSTLTLPWDSLVGIDPDGFWDPAEPTQLKIPAGKGIRKIRLHAHLDIDGATIASSAQLLIAPHKNGAAEFPGTGRVACEVGFTNHAQSLHSGVIDVVDGDVFTVIALFGSDSSVAVLQEGSYFQIEVIEASSTAGAGNAQGNTKLPRNYIDGLILANGADADHEITIAAGQAYATNDGSSIDLTAPLTIDIEEAGDRIGATTLAANSTYHVLVGMSGGSPIAGFADTAELGNGLPSGWSSFRRVGSVLTDGSSNIRGFLQRGDSFLWEAVPPAQNETITSSDTPQNFVLADLPKAIEVEPFVIVNQNTSGGKVTMVTPGVTPLDPDGVNDMATRDTTGIRARSFVSAFWTNANGEMTFIAEDASTALSVVVYGWRDSRGKG